MNRVFVSRYELSLALCLLWVMSGPEPEPAPTLAKAISGRQPSCSPIAEPLGGPVLTNLINVIFKLSM